MIIVQLGLAKFVHYFLKTENDFVKQKLFNKTDQLNWMLLHLPFFFWFKKNSTNLSRSSDPLTCL